MGCFVYPAEHYKRSINIIQEYIEQMAVFLNMKTGKPIDQCRDYVNREIKPGGKFAIQDPKLMYLAKESHGNRDKYEGTLLGYLATVNKGNYLMSPSMTVYVPTSVKKSLIAEYIEGKMLERKGYKHQAQEAEMACDVPTQLYYGVLQTSCKVKNNSVSGAHSSPSTPLYNKSSHSTLTSTCRVATSYSNASNERFIAGNRHYYYPEVVINSIITIETHHKKDILEQLIERYQLHIPTTRDVMECIRRSTSCYWRNETALIQIESLVDDMSDTAKVCFLYETDLYHMAKHNRDMIYSVLTDFSERAEVPYEGDALKLVRSSTGDMIALASALCTDVMVGSLTTMYTDHPVAYRIVAATIVKLNEVHAKYQDLFEGLFRATTLPPGIARLPDVLRRAVVTSDTDSTIFTAQYWTEWYVGKLDFSRKSYGVGYSMVFLASQLVKNLLAMLCANLGVPSDQIHDLKMKNEYYFPTFSLTSNAKHYYSFISACEGSVYKELKLEVKGVNLRSSNAPKEVTKGLHGHMSDLMTKFMQNGTVDLKEAIDPIAKLERDVYNDLTTGGHRYLRSMQIKESDAYQQQEDAPAYKHHLMWNEVFADKYGTAPELPYASLNISLTTKSKSKVATWIAAIEDPVIAAKLQKWVLDNEKLGVNTLRLPVEIVAEKGIPTELLPVLAARKLTMDIMKPYYIQMESLGLFMLNKRNTRMLLDEYTVGELVA